MQHNFQIQANGPFDKKPQIEAKPLFLLHA
jgi:hypothetical protein